MAKSLTVTVLMSEWLQDMVFASAQLLAAVERSDEALVTDRIRGSRRRPSPGARSATDAVRAWAQDAAKYTGDSPPPSEGTFVGIPERSWRPVTVRTETQTIIRLDTPGSEEA
jgi:hypothetical protein